MHTAEQLNLGQFQLEVRGEPTAALDFLNWSYRDRLGVIVDRPYGGLGCSLAIQMATAAFFALENGVRKTRRVYADNYLFHVGGRWGNFSTFDFWPERREVFLPADPAAVLAAVNDHGITHLLVPDGESRALTFPYKEAEASEDRLKLCLLYSSSGVVADADVAITTRDARALENLTSTLSQERLLNMSARELMRDVPGYVDDIARFRAKIAARIEEVGPEQKAPAAARVREAVKAGVLVETYRRCRVDFALQRLIGDIAVSS